MGLENIKAFTLSSQLAEIANKYRPVTKELFDQAYEVIPNITDGKYLDNSGNESNLASYAISSYIPVLPTTVYILSQIAEGQILFGGWYTSNKTYIEAITLKSTALTTIPIVSPSTAAFVRININKSLTFTSYSLIETTFELSSWHGKKANFLGDSTTKGHPDPNIHIPFPTLLKGMLGLSVARNYGVNGSNVQSSSGDGNESFTKRYSAMDDDADLIVALLGTNDFGHNLPLGTIADTTDVSFYGALDVLSLGLIKKYPTSTIVFCTPMHRNNIDTGVSSGGETNNGGKKLSEYVDAIIERGKKYGIPVYNSYAMSGIQPAIVNPYTVDELHLNAPGHKKFASGLAGFLNSL